MNTAEREARKALVRLQRALEKTLRELTALERALCRAEGDDFPEGRYREVRLALEAAGRLLEEEAERLEEKILLQGGLEPGRVRRSSARE